MPTVIFLGEIAILAAVLCGMHALKPRFGPAPFYMLLGLLEVFLFVSGKGEHKISVQMFYSVTHISTPLCLSLILTGLVLIYVLDGTRAAQRFMVAMAVVYVVHGCIDVMLGYHAAYPPSGFPNLADTTLVQYSLWARFASFLAILADFITILVVYQFLRNRMAWAPLGIPVYIALVAAMAMDAFAYSAINGTLVGPEGLRLIEKLEGGLAAGLPVAIYLTVQLRRRSRGEADLLLDRSSLEILDLRSQVKHAELLLKEQRAKYNYIKDTLSRYVSEDVANTLINDPSKIALGGETKEVTILFADVRGYSSLSEHVEPTELIDLLNRYLAKVSRQILDQHGMINEFEGDGILAVFGAPLELQHHAEHATEAALRMLEAVKQLNQEWQADGTHKKWQNAGIKDLAIRIGLHSGKVVAGNIGTEARMKYAVIGDTVNTASRIEALNKILDTSLLLSRPTFERLNPQRQMAAHPLGSHQLKGKAEPVEVFTLVS